MPDSIDQQLAIADVYANALFALARQQNAEEAIRGELDELVRLEQADASFAAFMKSSAIDADRRAASLEKMFRGKLSDTLLNTLLVMNRNGRCGLAPQLHRRFVVYMEEAAGQVEVTATSAVGLTDEQKQAVTAKAAALTGKAPVMEWVVTASILGGLILQIGDLRYDNSVRRQLETARSKLLQRSEAGLNIRMLV